MTAAVKLFRPVACLAVFSGLLSASAQAQPSGAVLFDQNCSACHQITGKGIPGAFPALAGDAFVKGAPTTVISVVLKGRGGMPTFAADLNDAQIAAILTYVRSTWGNHAAAVPPKMVASVRGAPAPNAPRTPMQAH